MDTDVDVLCVIHSSGLHATAVHPIYDSVGWDNNNGTDTHVQLYAHCMLTV